MAGVWGGHIPLRRVAADPVPDRDARGSGAEDVARARGHWPLDRVRAMTQPSLSAPWSSSSRTPSAAA